MYSLVYFFYFLSDLINLCMDFPVSLVQPFNMRLHTLVTQGRYRGMVIMPLNWVKQGYRPLFSVPFDPLTGGHAGGLYICTPD